MSQKTSLGDREPESHPSWGVVTLNRTSTMGPKGGASLFQSDVLHSEFMTLRIHEAERQRSHGGDHVYARKTLIEVEMSKLQWAELVSSINMGGGVPCTFRYKPAEGPLRDIERPPYIPRTLQSVKEVTDEAQNLVADIQSAFEEYMRVRQEKLGKKELDRSLGMLRACIENAVPNAKHTARRFEEHVDTVIQQAKSDITADLQTKARALGLPTEVDVSQLFSAPDTKELEAGDA